MGRGRSSPVESIVGEVFRRSRAAARRRAERALRFAAHTATLDREQKTAAAYADAVTDVERWLQRSQSDRLPWAGGMSGPVRATEQAHDGGAIVKVEHRRFRAAGRDDVDLVFIADERRHLVAVLQ
jgi:hypothetical protein